MEQIKLIAVVMLVTAISANCKAYSDKRQARNRQVLTIPEDLATTDPDRESKDLPAWPFLSLIESLEAKKPTLSSIMQPSNFGSGFSPPGGNKPSFSERPKPVLGGNRPFMSPQPVWSWSEKDKGWSSVGWISIPATISCSQTGWTVPSTATGWTPDEVTVTQTETVTSTDYTTSTGWGYTTQTVMQTGWVSSIVTQTETDYVTSTMLTTITAVLDVISTHTVYETSTISATQTLTDTVTSTATSTTVETDTTTVTETSTTISTGWGWNTENAEATIILEPSVSLDMVTSTVTMTLTETPTETLHVSKDETVTTDYSLQYETLSLPLYPPIDITATEIVQTPVPTVVDMVTTTLTIDQHQCTETEYEYMATVTTPAATITASQCIRPCAPFAKKCIPICTTKTVTSYIDVTTTSIVTASKPFTVTYSGKVTKTDFNFLPSVLTTTSTVVETASQPVEVTLTSAIIPNPANIVTKTTQITLTDFPVTLTTTQDLCRITAYETCITTETAQPLYVTLTDTNVFGIEATVTATSTDFMTMAVPTVTNFIPGETVPVTDTVTEITTANCGWTMTTTVTDATTTVGYGWTTVTPTVTLTRTLTETVTSTPLLSTMNIKTNSLILEESVTLVEGTQETIVLTPTTTCVVEATASAPPTFVTETTVIVQISPSASQGWKAPNSAYFVDYNDYIVEP